MCSAFDGGKYLGEGIVERLLPPYPLAIHPSSPPCFPVRTASDLGADCDSGCNSDFGCCKASDTLRDHGLDSKVFPVEEATGRLAVDGHRDPYCGTEGNSRGFCRLQDPSEETAQNLVARESQ